MLGGRGGRRLIGRLLIAARALQGAGAAAVMPLSLALLAGSVSKKLRPLAIGVWGGVAGLGVALGPLIGGAVVEGLTWNAIFWLNVPVGVVAIVLAYVALGEAFGRTVRLDWTGLALAASAVFGLVFGIMGDRWGRARTMLLTILIYSMFTGLTALSTTWWDFMLYRFLTGMGVGGEFAAGVALLAHPIPYRLGLFLAAIAGIVAATLADRWPPPARAEGDNA